MEQWLGERDRLHWIAVTGSHGVVEAYKHPDFRTILRSADLSLPDGRWTARVAAKKMSRPTRQVRGVDLLPTFCELAARKGYTNYFYGDTDDTLARASDHLRTKYPGLKIAGIYSPPFRELSPSEDAQIVEEINRANPDVLWVALGLPKQERWVFAHRERLKATIIVAVGAAVKFHSGKVKPAPRWASQAGLEWLWRFLHEPRVTWRRAFVYGPQFAALSLLELVGNKKRPHEARR